MGNNTCKKCFTKENEKSSELIVGNSQEIKTKPLSNQEAKKIAETEQKIEINSETLNSNSNNNNEYKNQNIQLNQNFINFYENSNSNDDNANYGNFDEDSSFLNDVNSRMVSKKALPIENKEKNHEKKESGQNNEEIEEEHNNERWEEEIEEEK